MKTLLLFLLMSSIVSAAYLSTPPRAAGRKGADQPA